MERSSSVPPAKASTCSWRSPTTARESLPKSSRAFLIRFLRPKGSARVPGSGWTSCIASSRKCAGLSPSSPFPATHGSACAFRFTAHSKFEGDQHGRNVHAPQSDPARQTQDQGLRGMPQDGRHLGSSSLVFELRPRRLLRLLEKQARHETLSRREASRRPLAGTGRELDVVLRG